MHFLAEGRNDRIQRWIAEQVQSSKAEESSEELDTTVPTAVQRSSPGGKEENGALWQMEDLEREMALTAYAFGRKNWPVSTGSIDTSILDFADLKRMSQLVIQEQQEQGQEIVPQVQVVVEPDLPSPGLLRPHDKRRDARILSQPPVVPPTPPSFDLPSPIIHRAVPAPAPIETTSRISDIPPIAFVFQETASPSSNSIHFTPIPSDSLDAFPSTPRSFTSFFKHLSDASGQNQIRFQELFLSPRLVTPKVTHNAPTTKRLSGLVASPTTPYSMNTESCGSTPSLSLFPPTPASTFLPRDVSGLPFSIKHEMETVPPVPEVPHDSPTIADETTVSSPIDPENFRPPFPPFPSPALSPSMLAPETVVQNPPITTTTNTHANDVHSHIHSQVSQPGSEKRDALELLSDSASDILSGPHSSRFSVFSSKFSISSLEEPNKVTNDQDKGSKWTSRSSIGKGNGSHSRSRAASVSTSHTGGSKKPGHKSPSGPLSRNGSRNEKFGPLGHVRGGHHSRAASKAGSRSGSGSLAIPDLSAGPSSLNMLISEEMSLSPQEISSGATGIHSALPVESSPGLGSVCESPSHKSTNSKGRTFISRISMGLRRSRSYGSNNNSPRPPRMQRNKTHAVTLSGSNVTEHAYFNTNMNSCAEPLVAGATSASAPSVRKLPVILPDNFSVATSPTLLQRSMSPTTTYSNALVPVSSPSPKQTPRLTLATQLGSTTNSTSAAPLAIRYPLTPKTPASSISTSFFGGNGAESSALAEPLPTIKWRECLILRGVNRDNKYDEPVIRWCEQLGEVEDILRVRGSGTVVVYFKEEDVMKKHRGVFEPREVNIAGVGIVTINWSRTMLHPERRPTS